MARNNKLHDTLHAINLNLLIACTLVASLISKFQLKGWVVVSVVYTVVVVGQWLNKKTLKVS